MRRLCIAAGAALLLLGCHPHDHPHDDHSAGEHGAAAERPGVAYTLFGPRTELFVEFPALVSGLESPFAAHLTTLHDFKPLAAGEVAVVLSGGGAPEERFETEAATVPGIFRPVAVPRAAGERQLAVEVSTPDGVERHELGTVQVAASAEAVAAPEDGGEAEIVFLKEQQWRIDFATVAVAPRRLRPAVAANGVIAARADGEAYVTAPLAGRLVGGAGSFPRLGSAVARDDVLAAIAPRLGADSDVASLERELTQAGIARDHARRERERLEGLLAAQAVAERRVIEARHEEASADAALIAARRRLQQFRGTQRAASDGASAIELRAPLAGTVVAVDAAPGAFVAEGHPLFHIVDLGRVWLRVQIPESDVGRVGGAESAWFTVDGFAEPFEVGAGGVVALGGLVDPHTRTVPLVFELDNPGGRLRVGMFARVHVVVGAAREALAIPVAAVVEDGGQETAYAQIGGEAFARRPLRLGIRDAGWVEVLDGLQAGDRVVTRGAYQVRLAAAADAVPAHGHAH